MTGQIWHYKGTKFFHGNHLITNAFFEKHFLGYRFMLTTELIIKLNGKQK